MVLTFHKGAIWGWTAEAFEATVEQPLADRDPFADDVMDFAHALLAPAQDVDVDGQGRVRIPAPLRTLAGLDKDVVVNSLLNRVEIWSHEAWDERFRQSLDRSKHADGMPRER